MHRVSFLALLKLSCQQGINWKGFNYSLSTLHQGCPGFLALQAALLTPKTVLCCSAQNCWHPWVLFPGEKWPLCVPCLTSQPSTGTSRLGSGCWVPSSSGLPDLAAHPGSWGLAEHQSPSKGVGSYRFGPSTMETILCLQGIMDVFSFRMCKKKHLRELVPSVEAPEKLLCMQTNHFWACRSLFGSFQGQFLEVSYSQIIVARKNFSIEIRTLCLKKTIRFLPNPQPVTLWKTFWSQIHLSKDKKWKWQATVIIANLILCNKWE